MNLPLTLTQPSKPILILSLLLTTLTFFFFLDIGFLSHAHGSSLMKPNPKMGDAVGITHIVMFRFKESVKVEEVDDVCNRMLALRGECLHPDTQKPYLKSVVGGKQNSAEGLDEGLTHVFVVGFGNEEDRIFYLERDEAHLGFVRGIKDVVERVVVVVVDFGVGVF